MARRVRGLPTTRLWSVNVELVAAEPTPAAQFAIEIFAEEWGFSLRRGDQQSWVRVTDVPFVHGRDDFALLSRTPRLESLRTLLHDIEREQALHFDRTQPRVMSSFGNEHVFAAWAKAL